MLSHDLQRDTGILVLMPEGPLEAADFETLAAHVDAYLEQNGTLHGVMVKAREFPGWKNFTALLAHLKFVKGHHSRIEKVAVVADGSVASILPHMAGHFLKAEVRQFSFDHEDAAWKWLTKDVQAAQPVA